MYVTIAYFTDLQDEGHPYEVGDVYPRKGLTPSPERITELSGSANRRGLPLIEEVEVGEPELPAGKPKAKKTEAGKAPAKKSVKKK